MAFWERWSNARREKRAEKELRSAARRAGISDVAADFMMEHMRKMEPKRDLLYKAQDISSDDYGFAPDNPICTYDIDSSKKYLSMLRDPAGFAFTYKRLRSIIMKEIHGIQEVPVDEYELYANTLSPAQKAYKIYLCPYGRDTFVAPKGLNLVKTETLPTPEQICKKVLPKFFCRFHGGMNASGDYIFHLPTRDGLNRIVVTTEEIKKLEKAVVESGIGDSIFSFPPEVVSSCAEHALEVEFCLIHLRDIHWESESKYAKALRDLELSQCAEEDVWLKDEAKEAGMTPAQFKALSRLSCENFIELNLNTITDTGTVTDSGTIICEKCGAKISKDSNFCNCCGALISKKES